METGKAHGRELMLIVTNGQLQNVTAVGLDSGKSIKLSNLPIQLAEASVVSLSGIRSGKCAVRTSHPDGIFILSLSEENLTISKQAVSVKGDYGQSVALSPDGHMLAYMRREVADAVDVVTLELSTGQETVVGKSILDWSLDWSPDGIHLAYFKSISKVSGRTQASVILYDVSKNTAKVIGRGVELPYSSCQMFSPKSDFLVYQDETKYRSYNVGKGNTEELYVEAGYVPIVTFDKSDGVWATVAVARGFCKLTIGRLSVEFNPNAGGNDYMVVRHRSTSADFDCIAILGTAFPVASAGFSD